MSDATSDDVKGEDFILRLFVIGFHHKKGHQIEYSYSSSGVDEKLTEEECSVLMSSSLPDGVHQREKDLIYFHFNTAAHPQRTRFGLASYRQVDAKDFVHLHSDITRNSIQKSVTLLLSKPLCGVLATQLESLTATYFLQKDFHRHELFGEFVDALNSRPPSDVDPRRYSLRQLVNTYRRKALILFKVMLLQKKVLFLLQPLERLAETMFTLVSLIPNLLDKGLDRAAVIEDLPPRRPTDDPAEQDDEDDDDDEEETLFDVGRSLSSHLLDTFTRFRLPSSKSAADLTEATPPPPPPPAGPTDRPTFQSICSSLPFPLDLFNQNHLFHPYLSIHSLSLLTDARLRSYWVGSSNQLFRLDEKSFDLIVDDQHDDWQILSSTLKSELQLTTADLRFTQLFEDQQTKEIVSEEELRRWFLEYLLSLLAVCQSSNVESMSDFNLSFVRSFQRTDAFQQWKKKSPRTAMKDIPAKHPQAGQLNVNDVKLKFSHVLNESEAGRKVRDALQETSEFIGEKSRSAGKIFQGAKNSLFSSFIRTFEQNKSANDQQQQQGEGEETVRPKDKDNDPTTSSQNK